MLVLWNSQGVPSSRLPSIVQLYDADPDPILSKTESMLEKNVGKARSGNASLKTTSVSVTSAVCAVE